MRIALRLALAAVTAFWIPVWKNDVTLWDEIVRKYPLSGTAYFNRGNAFTRLNQFENAIISYDLAISINPDYAEVYFTRGNALQALKKLDAAVTSYETAVSLKPNYATAYFSLGNALQQLKKYEIGFVLILKTLHVYGSSLNLLDINT